MPSKTRTPLRVHLIQPARLLADRWLLLLTVANAAAGSYTHLSTLAGEHGQHGLARTTSALFFDMMAVAAAAEMQRDKRRDRRLGRNHRFWTWPLVIFMTALSATVAGNLATSSPGYWGHIWGAAPPIGVMVVVALMERRATLDAASPETAVKTSPETETRTSGDRETRKPPETRRSRPAASTTGSKVAPGWNIPEGHRINGLHSAEEELRRAILAVGALQQLNPGRKVTADALRATCGKGKQWALDQLNLMKADGELAARREGSAG